MPLDVELEGGVNVTLEDDQLDPTTGQPKPEVVKSLLSTLEMKKDYDRRRMEAAQERARQAGNEKTLGRVRLGAELAGGVAGGLLTRTPTGATLGRGMGKAFARILLGADARATLGSVAGARLGTLPVDVTKELIDNMSPGTFGMPTNPDDPGSYVERLGRDAAIDLVGGRVTAGGLKFLQATGSTLLGLNTFGKQLGFDKAKDAVTGRVAAAAKDYGIHLGIADVSQSRTVQGFQRALGVVPLVSKPFRKSAERRAGEVAGALQEGPTRIAALHPGAPLPSMVDLGIDMARAAKNMSRFWNDEINRLYDDWRALAKSTGTLFDLSPARQTALDIVDEIAAAKTRTAPVTLPSGQTASANIPSLRRSKYDTFVRRLSEAPDSANVTQWESLKKDAWEMASKADGVQAEQLTRLARALDEAGDPDHLIGPQEVIQAKAQANQFSSLVHSLYDRPTAAKFKAVDSNIFTSKPFQGAGSAYADQLFDRAFMADSPQGLMDLWALVGPGNFKNAFRAHLDKAFQSGVSLDEAGILQFNVNEIRRNLGLMPGMEKSALRQGLKNAMDLVNSSGPDTGKMPSSVAIPKLEKFLDVLEAATRSGVPDVSTFMLRKTTLSGKAGLLAMLSVAGSSGIAGAAAGGAGVGLLSSIGSLMLLRGVGHFLTKPKLLDRTIKVLDSDTGRAIAGTEASILMRDIWSDILEAQNGRKPSEAEVNTKVFEVTSGVNNPNRPRSAIPLTPR